VTELSITPSEAKAGEEVTVYALVTNTGDAAGSCKLTLSIEGAAQATSTMNLAGGQSDRVTFSILSNAPGVFKVDVNGVTGSFEVKETPDTAPESGSTGTAPTQGTRGEKYIPITKQEQLGGTPEATTKVVNWATLGMIIGATFIVIVAVVVVILIRRRDMLRGYIDD